VILPARLALLTLRAVFLEVIKPNAESPLCDIHQRGGEETRKRTNRFL